MKMKHIIIALGLMAMGCNINQPADGAGGAGGAPDIDVWGKISTEIIELPPQSTQNLCQNFANPFGQDVKLDHLVVRGDPNTESVEIFLVDGAHDSGIGSCLVKPPTLLYSGAPQADVEIDPAALPTKTGLMIRARFTNSGDAASDGFVIVRLHAE